MHTWIVYRNGDLAGKIECPFAKASGAKHVASMKFGIPYKELTVKRAAA